MNVKILLLASVFSATLGQLLFKKGMMIVGNISSQIGVVPIYKILFNIVFSPLVFIGLLSYVVSTVLWLVALSKTELSYAYPFTLLTFILVMTCSYFLFSESLSINRIIGAAIICIGVIIVSLK